MDQLQQILANLNRQRHHQAGRGASYDSFDNQTSSGGQQRRLKRSTAPRPNSSRRSQVLNDNEQLADDQQLSFNLDAAEDDLDDLGLQEEDEELQFHTNSNDQAVESSSSKTTSEPPTQTASDWLYEYLMGQSNLEKTQQEQRTSESPSQQTTSGDRPEATSPQRSSPKTKRQREQKQQCLCPPGKRTEFTQLSILFAGTCERV